MRCTCYRIDPATLVAALTDAEILHRYQAHITDEMPSLAEREQVKHLRKLVGVAAHAVVEGFEEVARRDLANADELLSDVFAVATYHAWPLPAENTGDREVDVDGLPRGLLGADLNPESASLWLLDGTTLALARARVVGDVVDLAERHQH